MARAAAPRLRAVVEEATALTGNFESTTVSFGRAAPPFATHSTAFQTTLARELGERVEESSQSDASGG